MKIITINGVSYEAQSIAMTQEDYHHGVVQLWKLYRGEEEFGVLARWGLGTREGFGYQGKLVEVVGLTCNQFGVWI